MLTCSSPASVYVGRQEAEDLNWDDDEGERMDQQLGFNYKQRLFNRPASALSKTPSEAANAPLEVNHDTSTPPVLPIASGSTPSAPAAASNANAEAVDKYVASSAPYPVHCSTDFAYPTHSPSRYLDDFWRSITKIHSPRYQVHLSRSQKPQYYGCTLHLHFPPSSTRTFTAPTTFLYINEAKDAVARMALDAGVCEEGKRAREEAGEEEEQADNETESKSVLELDGDAWATVDNPAGILSK